MKRLNLILVLAILTSAIFIQSCKKDEMETPDDNSGILPSSFKVDIPDALSGTNGLKNSNIDTLQGNEIYEHMRTFVEVGENAAQVVEDIIRAIQEYNINKPMSFTYISEDDNRQKHLEVIENVTFEGKNWEFQLTITDQGPSTGQDDGKAMQVFWNRNPVKGIAILKPYNIDRLEFVSFPDAMYRVDYSEAEEMEYASHMIVSITGIPLEDPLVNPYSLNTIKMFAGKNGSIVDVYGNSDHPNAKFFTNETGFDWAFVGSGNLNRDIGVAEVGLPSNTLNSSSRNTILVENSIKNVFTRQIYEIWPFIDSTSVQAYLYNTDAPGFFDHNGFVQGGVSPHPQYNILVENIADLTPYNPKEINELQIFFKE